MEKVHDKPLSGQAFDSDTWTYKMSISGPQRSVNIEGKLIPMTMKRRAEGDLSESERPWTMVRARECDTMFEGLGGRIEHAVDGPGPTLLEDSQVTLDSQVLED